LDTDSSTARTAITSLQELDGQGKDIISAVTTTTTPSLTNDQEMIVVPSIMTDADRCAGGVDVAVGLPK
jgi:hypothetical protein